MGGCISFALLSFSLPPIEEKSARKSQRNVYHAGVLMNRRADASLIRGTAPARQRSSFALPGPCRKSRTAACRCCPRGGCRRWRSGIRLGREKEEGWQRKRERVSVCTASVGFPLCPPIHPRSPHVSRAHSFSHLWLDVIQCRGCPRGRKAGRQWAAVRLH